MVDTVDHQPPFVSQSSVNAEDATPHSRETEEKSTNESSSCGDICIQVPKNSRYSLRTRNVDEATQWRREEHKRMREERIQNKLLRKQRKIREAQERVDRILKIQAILDEKSKAWKEEQRKQRLSEQEGDNNTDYFSTDEEVEKNYTHEVINEPPEGSGEWLPYESDNEFGTELELKCTSWGVEKFTLELARCVVGLESFTGDKQLFACSGTIVEFLNDTGYVVTSASLVRCSDKDVLPDELKINVCLADGEILEGFVSNVDFYYNICVIEVPSTFHLPRKSFSPKTEFFNFYEHHSKDVVALGRTCKPWRLMVALGKLIPRRSKFDCEELSVSSCKVSKRGVGGPLMDFDGNVIGMSFYDKKGTPFLPSFIVLKCLQHFKTFGKVMRPLHGLRVKNLYDAELTELEEKQCGLPVIYGVIVDKVEDSSTEHSEIKVGDVITHVNGVPFSNAAELGGLLLDMCGKHMLDRQKLNLSEDCNQTATVMNLKFRARTYKGRKSEITTQTIDVDKFTPSGLNRWPLPRPIIVRRYAYGELIEVQRYTTDA
ncbi:uncharacterized protein LOC133901896 [Phragmites australis]|uniref:uncharacterized protein LOC133901896 n=1 Tax=Phragmites australis TaxID=29695 RepID=UPI002D76A0B8|nr:uncharacterized protein LOC133901896 [Phragmites australis]XP_062199418.1 uncharacterized protein LOC133901896 [Phragmites australis]